MPYESVPQECSTRVSNYVCPFVFECVFALRFVVSILCLMCAVSVDEPLDIYISIYIIYIYLLYITYLYIVIYFCLELVR